MGQRLLARRLRDAGFAVASIAPATGGVVAQAGLVTLADGSLATGMLAVAGTAVRKVIAPFRRR